MLLEIGFLVVILVILAVAIVTFPKIGQPIELVKIIVRLKKKILMLYAVVITIKTEDYFSPKVIKNIAKLKRVMQNILVKTLVINNINQEDLGGILSNLLLTYLLSENICIIIIAIFTKITVTIKNHSQVCILIINITLKQTYYC